jgi:hypothetical protein
VPVPEETTIVTSDELAIYMDIRFSMRQTDAAKFVLEGLQSELETFLGRPLKLDEVTETHVIPATHLGVPATSFFYDSSLNSTGETLNYLLPSITIPLRNSPVVSVKQVKLLNTGTQYQIMGEAILRTATVTGAVQSGSTATYTATGHGFTVGQTVSISGITPTSCNVSAKRITSVTSNTFTVGEINNTFGTYVSGGTANANGNDYTVQRYGLELYRGFANDVVEVIYTGGLEGENIKLFRLMILRAATREMQNMHDDVVGTKDLNTRNVAPLETGFLEKELMAMRRYRRRRI